MYSTWALRGLFNIDWRALGRDSTDVKAARAEEFLQLVDGQLRWRKPCPSCYTFCVPGIQPSMPSNFKELDPVVAGECIVDFDARQLNIPSGLIADARKPVRVAVVLLEPVITYDESRGLQFRTADPPKKVAACQGVCICECERRNEAWAWSLRARVLCAVKRLVRPPSPPSSLVSFAHTERR